MFWPQSFKHLSEVLLALRPTDGAPLKLKFGSLHTVHFAEGPKMANEGLAFTELASSCFSGLRASS